MHKSKLGGFIVDCRTGDLAGAARFWAAALGMRVEPFAGEEGKTYAGLTANNTGLHIEVQIVDHPSRVHLDIETDNIEAEVARLEALGARRVAQVKTWWVMEAPTGHRFCVVSSEGTVDFDAKASTWT
jgi:predicted enzyme related to lactoylglutathione lyase